MKNIVLCLALIFCCSLTYAQQQLNVNTTQSITANLPQKSNTTSNSPDFTDPAVANDQRCGTMPGVAHRVANDPEYAQFYNQARQVAKSASQSKIPCDGTNSIVVPVAFHFAPGVVTCGDSDCLLAEVQDQLDAMNIAFGSNTGTAAEAACPAAYQDANGNSVASTGTCISFCLAIPPAGGAAGLDPACDPPITVGVFTGGFNAGGGGAPGWNGIMNLFITSNATCLGVADGIPGNGSGDGVSTCAAAFGGLGASAGCGLDTDGTYNLGATMIHEIGHYLGLFHTHVDGAPTCADNDVNAPGPFNVNDTPIMANQFYGCPTGCVTNTSQGTGGACGATNVPTANFMAYTDDACMSMFTEDQAAVMNYWANQLFGGNASQCSGSNPTELTSLCENLPCVLVCPASVDTPLALTEDLCAALGTYDLPADPTTVGLVLDDASDAVYTWSTGNYLSAGGAATTNTVTLTSPAGCAPETLELFLNVDCGTTPLGTTLDGGTATLNVYPDPAQLAATDLVTVSGENTCDEPVIAEIADCAGLVTITPDAANPTFPVAAGMSGTANYTVTYDPDAAGGPDCCLMAGMEGELITDGDLENSASWTEIEEVPAGTPNPNPFGVIGVSGGALNGTNDAWLGGWAGSSFIGITQNITIDPNCAEVTLNFDYGGACNGGTLELEILIGGTVIGTVPCTDGTGAIGPTVIPTSSIPTGATTITFQGEEIGTANPSVFIDNISLVSSNCSAAVVCDFPLTADYNCTTTGVGYCDNICFAEYVAMPGPDDFVDATLCVNALGCADSPDATCLTTAACDDGDDCTENEMETTVTETGEVCTACAGTPVATCTLPSVAQACDDNDPCTENDMEEVDACDATVVCVPCAGTPVATCTLPSVAQACDDGDPCTTNDMEEVDACDATIVCVPCAGTVDMASCDAACTTTMACDDGDPCTMGEMETMAADGSVCVPCGGGMAVTPACGDPTATNYDMDATCIDNTLCTYGEYCDNICYAEYAENPNPGDMPNATLCVTPLGCADLATIDPSCITTGPCDDGAPCTENETATVIIATNDTCTDCANGTAVTPACGDPTADNYDATAVCIDNTLCTYTTEPDLNISDPCACGNPLNIMIDPADDPADPTLMVAYFADEVTIEAPAGATITIDNTSPASSNIFDAAGTDITSSISIADFTNTGDSDNDGLDEWVAIIWHPVDVGYTLSVDVDGTPLNIGNSCTQCLQSIPTVGEWGLIILGLMMSIVAIIGIRARREEEAYS